MPRFFNTAGPCDPERHYMLPPERRLPEVRRLIEQGLYFVVHAPRQVGKTTAFRALARELTAAGTHVAVLSSCETAQGAGTNVERGIPTILAALSLAAEIQLPESLRPPQQDPTTPAEGRLQDLLQRWAQQVPRPIVLFLDEIDALFGEVLISALRQLRGGYADRPQNFPASVALIGLRDVRDYRIAVRPEVVSLGTSSPFNIKVESLTLRNFTAEEVAELLTQHTEETGQVFAPEALALTFELSQGQPWLVNALARQATEKLVPDESQTIPASAIAEAAELLIVRRDTHLDSLVERLREPRVQRVIEPILAGELLATDLLDDDLRFVSDLGLIREGTHGLEIANPIYREVIPRALTFVLEHSLTTPRAAYVAADGRLRFDHLLSEFRRFWREHAEAFLIRAPYPEAAPQLVFMAWLHRIVNGGGSIDRQYAVGRGRIDLLVRWPHPQGIDRFALELKVWRDGRADPLEQGLRQLSSYLDTLGLDRGTLLLFDARKAAPPLAERMSTEGRQVEDKQVEVLRL